MNQTSPFLLLVGQVQRHVVDLLWEFENEAATDGNLAHLEQIYVERNETLWKEIT